MTCLGCWFFSHPLMGPGWQGLHKLVGGILVLLCFTLIVLDGGEPLALPGLCTCICTLSWFQIDMFPLLTFQTLAT